MLVEYIQTALERTRYEKIKDKKPYYGEIPGLKGVWATGKTREDCRRQLAEALEGWIIVRLRKGLTIPKIKGLTLKPASRLPVHA
jgi:predicted RNase H-like HicB family nuclease